ncbi:hypothetical protein [Pseudotabrizicola sediminis]|uniref:hypothetical protein n=1 Tax=Pseudotabrizicola sediminis TaxID=2486418 RepID=UPI00107FFC08|nr:hypothetical protein [Pseudotabrizicola sediminis]
MNAVSEIIDRGWREKGIEARSLSPAAIKKLREIVGRYVQFRVFWDQFLSNGEIAELQKIVKSAQRLLNHLSALDIQGGAEHDEAPMLWLLLGSTTSLEKSSNPNFLEWRATLENIANLTVASPRVKVTDGNNYQVPQQIRARLRSELQHGLDTWWKSETGLSIAKDITKAEAFNLFLQCIFGRMSISNPPGATETSIANARRDYIDHVDINRKAAKLSESIRRSVSYTL